MMLRIERRRGLVCVGKGPFGVGQSVAKNLECDPSQLGTLVCTIVVVASRKCSSSSNRAHASGFADAAYTCARRACKAEDDDDDDDDAGRQAR